MKTGKYSKVKQEQGPAVNGFKEYLQTRHYGKDTVWADTNYTASFLAWITGEQTHENEVTYNDILTYIGHLTRERDSIPLMNRKLSAIRKYYTYLQYQGREIKNPVAGLFVRGKRQTVPSNLLTQEELSAIYENYQVTDLRGQRNKVIIGILVYQGVTREEIEKLEITHVKLSSGKIEIPAGTRSNARILPLEPLQMLDLQQYIQQTRPQIIQAQGSYGIGRKPGHKNAQEVQNHLFISMHACGDMRNSFLNLVHSLRRDNPKLINAGQIRQSVITLWLKTKDLRTTQYMAGHRYVSSTEHYQVNHLDDLQNALNIYHPLQ